MEYDLGCRTFSFSSASLTGFVVRVPGEEGVAGLVSAIAGELCYAFRPVSICRLRGRKELSYAEERSSREERRVGDNGVM